MQSQRKKITWLKLRQYLALMLFSVILAGCNQDSDSQEASSNQLSSPLPALIGVLALDETNLIVDVVVDGGTTMRVGGLVVDTVNKTFSGTISSVPAGAHTLMLVYSVRDPILGIIEIARTSSISVVVIANQDIAADFSSVTVTLARCVLDNSLTDGCTLG